MPASDEFGRELRSIEALLEEVKFQEFERSLAGPTLFDVLGIAFEERIHSRMLGWLLDPTESHGLGPTFLREFLYLAAKIARAKDLKLQEGRPITPLEAHTYALSEVTVNAEYVLIDDRRPDLVLRSERERERWLCVIENKILAGEGDAQTTDYYDQALVILPSTRFPCRLFVYLTPDGRPAASRHFIPMAYSELAALLRKTLTAASDFGRTVVDQYLKCIEGQVVRPEELRMLCWNLYRSHKTAIDAIVTYGKTHLLLTATAEQVLQALRTQNIIPDRQIEWESAGGRTATAIWPRHWPTTASSWRVYYGIFPKPAQGISEHIEVGLQFGRGAAELAGRFRGATEQTGRSGLLARVPITSKDLDDLPRAVEEAVKALLAIIRQSFDLMEDALGGDSL